MNDAWMKAAIERFRDAVSPACELSPAQLEAGLRAALDPIEGATHYGGLDWEYVVEDFEDIMDGCGDDDVVPMSAQIDLGCPGVWGATVCISIDDDGDPDETEYRLYRTEAEARAAWPDSVAALRKEAGYEA